MLHKDYDYFEVSFQSAQKIGYYNSSVDFVLDNDETMLNQMIELDGVQTSVSTLKAVMIDSVIAQILDENIDSGRNFETSDYKISGTKIPVLFGSEYAKDYFIGEELKLNYLSLDVSFVII